MIRRLAHALATLLVGSTLAFAQGTPEVDRAMAFRQAARDHRAAGWLDGYLAALLGSNHSATQPEVSRLLRDVAAADDRTAVERLLSKGAALPGASLAVEVAAAEAGWQPGKAISAEGATRLIRALPRTGIDTGRPHRVEAAEPPEAYRSWIHHEQFVNEKVSDRRYFADLGQNDVPRELDPVNGARYRLGHIEIPLEEVGLASAPNRAEITDQVIVTRGGRKFVRFFVHPLAEPYYKELIDRYGIEYRYMAAPSSSPRSLLIWDPTHARAPPLVVKTSLPVEVGELRRVIPEDKVRRGVGNSAMIAEAVARGELPRHIYMAETLGILPPGKSGAGMIVRELPADFARGEWLPGFALTSKDPQRPGDSRLVRMIKTSRADPRRFVSERVLRPYLEGYASLALGQGLIGEPHQQNVLFEVGSDGMPTGRVMFRDLDSYKVDVESRARRGLTLRPMDDALRPTKIFKTAKGEDYYETSYGTYVKRDVGYLLWQGLRRDFPAITEAWVHSEMDRIMAGQVERHLGLKPDLASGAELDLAGLVKEWRRRQVVEAERAAAAATPEARGLPDQRTLRSEFKRLDFNYRVQWVDRALTRRTIRPNEKFVLHDGAIEWRIGGRAAAFAFLEPSWADKDFYRGVPHPRKAPDAERLAAFYAPFDRELARAIRDANHGVTDGIVETLRRRVVDPMRRAPPAARPGPKGPTDPARPEDPARRPRPRARGRG
ncbi:MAG: hypothetical protein HY722_14775 [Planctomycetes bacterium]|nr:hypothetical protein [Planctomycetota bacterium]